MLKVSRIRSITSSIKNIYRMNSSYNSEEIELSKINHVGVITLKRPKQLNALNLPMVKLMQKQLDECESDENIQAILIKGTGDVAFCAGGDVKSIREECLKGNRLKAMQFFKEEYILNYRIANSPKPYIALINGITMGGGVGVSVHGRYRIATEKTLFAMPETAIGFFADVGGSYFLSRLRDHIGIYLVLTGNRLKGQDVKKTGIATHYLSSVNLPNLEKELLDTKNLNAQLVESILNKYNENVSGEFDSSKISQIFSASTLEETISNLNKDNSDWSKQQLKLLEKMSPTSLKVAIRQLNLGSNKNLKECLEMEYQLSQRFSAANDFFEGVRALLVDKGSKPNWSPASYKDIDNSTIDWYFNPLPEDDKLVLDLNSKL